MDDAREQIAPELVGAQPMRRRGWRVGHRQGSARRRHRARSRARRSRRARARAGTARRCAARPASEATQGGLGHIAAPIASRTRGSIAAWSEVAEQRAEHHRDGQHQQAALHQRIVALVERRDQQRAQARPGEDEFDGDGAAEDPADAQAKDGHHRQQRVAQDMAELDAPETAGPWHAARARNPAATSRSWPRG